LTRHQRNDTMVGMMGTTRPKIVSFLLVVMLCGCSTPPEAPSPAEGVKLRDLAPADAARQGLVLPPAISLRATTYAIPAARYERIARIIVATLDTGPGILTDARDFRENGFIAAAGGMADVRPLDEALAKAQATALSNNYYMVFDEKDNDAAVSAVREIRRIEYVSGGQRDTMTLRPGQLGLRIVARRFSRRSSVFRLTVQPIWKAAEDATFVERSTGISRNIVFDRAGIDTRMQAGDMVLIAPSGASHEGTTLADALMTITDARGEMKIVTVVTCTGLSQ